MRKRVVIDTSVWVAALKSTDGASRQILRLCLLLRCQPLIGQSLLLEYEDLTAREELFINSPLSGVERRELFDAFLSVSEWTPIFFLWRPNLPDESDNHLIELALAGAATTLITHNRRDFVHAELKIPALEILTPARFLQQWRIDHGHHDNPNP